MTAAQQRALAALERSGVRHALRKDGGPQELDLLVAPRDAGAAEATLLACGFVRFVARGQRAHRFYLDHESGVWTKIDVALARPRLLRRLESLLAPATARLPLGWRRLGPVIAILGPDGAGKGTLIEAVRAGLPVATEAVYLGRRSHGGGGAGAVRRRLPAEIREPLFVVKKLIGHVRALAFAYRRAWDGAIVLCDRHPLEALATRPHATVTGAALERILLLRIVPTPDAIVVLEAPVETLLARKSEHPADVLERWQEDYRRVFADVPNATFCRTDVPIEVATRQVAGEVWRALARRRRWQAATLSESLRASAAR